jgi:simple sugar transport system permease protein
VINIALEGLMLVGAFAAAAVTAKTGSPVEGALFGALAGVTLAAIYGLAVITFRTDQIVGGIAINMLAAGITPFACKLLYDSAGSTPALPIAARFVWGPMLWAWLAVCATQLVIVHTPLGLWLRFAGEHPAALDAAGIRVNRVRWAGVLLSGALAGTGGATLSVFLASSFSRNMTAGRGFMALAALIFGKWRPLPTAIACLLFGFSDALQTHLQGVVLWGHDPVPVQFIQILPYLVTIFLLAGFVGRSRAPRALGIAFEKN